MRKLLLFVIFALTLTISAQPRGRKATMQAIGSIQIVAVSVNGDSILIGLDVETQVGHEPPTFAPNEFQFTYAAPWENPPYYIPMADEPDSQTLAQRLASTINAVSSTGVIASADGDTVSLTSAAPASSLTLSSASKAFVLIPFVDE